MPRLPDIVFGAATIILMIVVSLYYIQLHPPSLIPMDAIESAVCDEETNNLPALIVKFVDNDGDKVSVVIKSRETIVTYKSKKFQLPNQVDEFYSHCVRKFYDSFH